MPKTTKPRMFRIPKPKSPIDSTLLTKPGKMPGFAFGLPAGIACPFSKVSLKQYGPESTCAWCYAMSGRYTGGNVVTAMQRRMDWVLASLALDDGEEFVRVMCEHIRWHMDKRPVGDRVFRIHDSGDFFNVAYARAWIAICHALPDVRFWAPTREHNRPVMLAVLRQLAALPNVVVRPSAVRMNDAPPVVAGFAAGTAVYDRLEDIPAGVRPCPASFGSDHTCDGNRCRACWFASDVPVAYRYHGSATAVLKRRAYLRRRELPVVG